MAVLRTANFGAELQWLRGFINPPGGELGHLIFGVKDYNGKSSSSKSKGGKKDDVERFLLNSVSYDTSLSYVKVKSFIVY